MNSPALWGHYLLSFYRTVARNRLYAALNVLGLAVGIAVFLVLSLLVRFETGFDHWLPESENLYRLTSTFHFPGRTPEVAEQSSNQILPALQLDFPHAVEGVRLLISKQGVANGDILHADPVTYADANFFDIFNLPLVAGDPRQALARPNNVVITETTANRYFGSTAVLGRSLTLFYDGRPQLYRVSAVLKDLPPDTNLAIGILAPFSQAVMQDPAVGWTIWGVPNAFTFVRIRRPTDARAIADDLQNFVKRHQAADSDIRDELTLRLSPLRTLHLTDIQASMTTMKPGVDGRLVYSLGVVGALALVIAILNYVNLATAQAMLRAREIALRKVLGATRGALIAQLLAEALAFALVSTLIGLALAELALPLIQALGGGAMRLAYWGAGGVLPELLGLAVVIGLCAGIYPALVLSRFEPAPVLASARTPGGGRLEARVRSGLITTQFVVVIAVAIGALVVSAQAAFLRAEDRGFDRTGLVFVDSFQRQEANSHQAAILNAFRGVPGVVSAAASLREVGLPNLGLIHVRRPGQKGVGPTLEFDMVGDDYLKTFGAEVVAGRMLDRAHRLDDAGGTYSKLLAEQDSNLMLNESAVRTLGFPSPAAAIGQRVGLRGLGETAPDRVATIIGVMRDIHFGSPQMPIASLAYSYSSQTIPGATGAVRYSGVDDEEMMRRLEAVWRRLAPTVPFEAKTAEEGLSQYYAADEQRARLFTVGALLAVAIGCVGLYGLAAFSTARRYREIGIRKTLGASTVEVLRLLMGQMLRPVLIANLIAWPLAYAFLRAWLAGYDQRIELSPLYFVGASVLALVVASLTVVAQSLRLARAEPARALRHE